MPADPDPDPSPPLRTRNAWAAAPSSPASRAAFADITGHTLPVDGGFLAQ